MGASCPNSFPHRVPAPCIGLLCNTVYPTHDGIAIERERRALESLLLHLVLSPPGNKARGRGLHRRVHRAAPANPGPSPGELGNPASSSAWFLLCVWLVAMCSPTHGLAGVANHGAHLRSILCLVLWKCQGTREHAIAVFWQWHVLLSYIWNPSRIVWLCSWAQPSVQPMQGIACQTSLTITPRHRPYLWVHSHPIIIRVIIGTEEVLGRHGTLFDPGRCHPLPGLRLSLRLGFRLGLGLRLGSGQLINSIPSLSSATPVASCTHECTVLVYSFVVFCLFVRGSGSSSSEDCSRSPISSPAPAHCNTQEHRTISPVTIICSLGCVCCWR